MSTPLKIEDVRAIARLARLQLTDAQLADDRARLSRVLDYVEQLRALDLTGVEPMTTPLVMSGPTAPDEPTGTMPHDALTRMAPAMDGPFIKVPKVLGDGGDA